MMAVQFTLQTSEVSGNSAVSVGGGVSNSGSLGITNTTLADNHAPGNGTISVPGNGGGIENTGSLTLLNVTVAGNSSSGTGGNIHLGATASSSMILQNTLVATGGPNNCDKAVTSQGNNLESANTCGLAGAGDKVNTNPHLGWLLYNRGLTRTLALYRGSPAIDAGSASVCPIVDQRGFARRWMAIKTAVRCAISGRLNITRSWISPGSFCPSCGAEQGKILHAAPPAPALARPDSHADWAFSPAGWCWGCCWGLTLGCCAACCRGCPAWWWIFPPPGLPRLPPVILAPAGALPPPAAGLAGLHRADPHR